MKSLIIAVMPLLADSLYDEPHLGSQHESLIKSDRIWEPIHCDSSGLTSQEVVSGINTGLEPVHKFPPAPQARAVSSCNSIS